MPKILNFPLPNVTPLPKIWVLPLSLMFHSGPLRPRIYKNSVQKNYCPQLCAHIAPSQNSSPPFNVVCKNLLQLLLVSVINPSIFISNFINVFWFHSSCDCIACKLIKYNQLQINENNPDETPYVIL